MPGEDLDKRLCDDLVAVGGGDTKALQRLYVASAGRLFAICLRITGDRSAGEDVLQETFIKVWNRAASFDPARARAMIWLGAIARNSAIDWYRAHNRHPASDDSAIALIPDEAEIADARMMREEEEKRVVASLGTLPSEHESELRDAFFQGLTYAQLAQRRGVPLGTMKSRIRRSLLLLRKTLEDG